jgi:hypothetical protein
MSVHIGGWEFDHASYDADADVLYLSMGGPRPGYGEETPEGHVLRFDEDGNFYGVTLISPKYLLDNGLMKKITLPQNTEVSPDEIGKVLEPA